MPEVTEGLERDGVPLHTYEDGDVNAPGGFEAALARSVAGTPDEGSADGEQQPEGEPAAAQTPPPEGEGEPAAPGEEPPEPSVDWEERYKNLETVVGRQGQQLGEREARIRELEQQQGGEPAAPEPGVRPGEMEELVATHGGESVVAWAVREAPSLIDDAIDAWVETGEPAALRYAARYDAALMQQPTAPTAPQDPVVTQMATERKWNAMRTQAAEGDEDLAKAINDALINPDVPDSLRAMVLSGNDDHMRVALDHLKPYAKMALVMAGKNPELAARSQTAKDANEAKADEKRKTAIVTGSQRLSAPEGEQLGTEMTRDERIAKFKEQFKRTATTDVSSGLTVKGEPLYPQN